MSHLFWPGCGTHSGQGTYGGDSGAALAVAASMVREKRIDWNVIFIFAVKTYACLVSALMCLLVVALYRQTCKA